MAAHFLWADCIFAFAHKFKSQCTQFLGVAAHGLSSSSPSDPKHRRIGRVIHPSIGVFDGFVFCCCCYFTALHLTVVVRYRAFCWANIRTVGWDKIYWFVIKKVKKTRTNLKFDNGNHHPSIGLPRWPVPWTFENSTLEPFIAGKVNCYRAYIDVVQFVPQWCFLVINCVVSKNSGIKFGRPCDGLMKNSQKQRGEVTVKIIGSVIAEKVKIELSYIL